MEKWPQGLRDDTAKKIKQIEDHSKRKDALRRLKIKNDDIVYLGEALSLSKDSSHFYSVLNRVGSKGIVDNNREHIVSVIKSKLLEEFSQEEPYIMIKGLLELKKSFPEIKIFLESEEIKVVYFDKLTESTKNKLLNSEDPRKFLELVSQIRKFTDNDEYLKDFLESDEVKKKADMLIKDSVVGRYGNHGLGMMMEICELCNISAGSYDIPEDNVVDDIDTLCIDGQLETVEKIFKIFPDIKDIYIESGCALSTIVFYLEEGDYHLVDDLMEMCSVPKEDVYIGIRNTIKKFLTTDLHYLCSEIPRLDEDDIIENGGVAYLAIELINYFELDNDQIEPLFAGSLNALSKKGDLKGMELIIDNFKDRFDIDKVKGNYSKIKFTEWLSKFYLISDIPLVKKMVTSLHIRRVDIEKVFNSKDISFDNKYILNTLVHPSLDNVMEKTYDLFGLNISEKVYLKIKDLIEEKNIDEEFKQIGVTEIGEKGFEQLRLNFHKIKDSWFSSDPDIDSIKSSRLIQNFFKNYVGYKTRGFNEDYDDNKDNSEDDEEEYDDDEEGWGNHDQASFDKTLEIYESSKDKILPVPEYMIVSDNVEVGKIDKKSKIEWSEQFLSSYRQFIDSIKECLDLIKKENKPLSFVTSEIQSEVDKMLSILKERVDHVSNEKAKIGITQRINMLESMNIRSVEDFQKNFVNLSKFKELHGLLRKSVLTFSFLKNRNQKSRMKSVCEQSLDIDATTSLLDFVDHITNQETMSEYFTDRQGRDAFKEIVGTKAIQEELSRIQNREVVGKTTMKFLPVRNILTEFSGHIADACWASKYESIARDFPNFTSVIFLEDPDTVDEKLAGACFLIESEDETGKKVLIIRGLNPTQGVINGLSISDFFDKFTSYVKEIAQKDDREVLLVLDGHSGGAGTNRPNLYEFMSNLKLPKVKLKSKKDTEFNGYDITDMCVKVE